MNLDRIQSWIDAGRLESSPEKPITARDLLLSGCIHDAKDGVKLLGDVRTVLLIASGCISTFYEQGADQLKTPIHITPARASKSAIKAVENLGGTVFCKYYNELALKDCLKGRTDRIEAAPVRQTDIGKEHSTHVSTEPLLKSF